jgi:8-oxo-dGTP pyrophosphatase MutT (NUDIX family)
MGKKFGPWEQLSTKVVHKNNYYYVRQDQVVKPDGSNGTYDVVVAPGAVFVVAMDADQNVYLEKLYRYANADYSIEVPGGSTDGQDSLAAAKRELQEETGLTAENWHYLGWSYPCNGLLTEKNYFYLATDVRQTGQNAQLEEGIEAVMKVSFNEILRMIKEGEFTDGQTITAMMKAALFLEKIT